MVILSFGQANAEIGFKYTPEWERLTDPTLHLGRPGLTNVLWDSTSIDTTLFDTLGIEFAEPDSLPGDSLVTDSLKIEESKTSPQTKEIEKQPKLTSSSLPEEKDLTSGSTGSSKGQDDFDAEDYEEEAEEEPEEAPWHPTLIKTIDPLVQISTEFDTSSNYVVISHKLYDSDLPFKGAMSVDNYLQRSIEFTDRESWRQSILNKMPTEKESAGTAIRISLPVFKSKRLKDIFGGRNIGLTVTGDINVKGSLRSEKKDESQVDSDKPTDYLFKIDQTQRFHIQGNVGEKVKVEIDQDSERMFEFENNLRVIYTGNEDEIIQKIEAGNVSLSLPGAKFVSGSGKHQGLFGIKTESRIGPLKIITIASLDKSEKNTKKIDGGSESSGTQKIKPYNFIQNRYFFLDYEYREQYKRRNDFDLRHIYDPNRKIIKYDVYRSIRGKLQVANPVQAWALYNPDNLDTSEVDKEHQKGTFQKLEPGADYHLNTE
ncbi:hypothetical protein H8D57_00890, partial [bacterium]|nr:hypothetical protein [bacterium]